jgi:hypothetical protein
MVHNKDHCHTDTPPRHLLHRSGRQPWRQCPLPPVLLLPAAQRRMGGGGTRVQCCGTVIARLVLWRCDMALLRHSTELWGRYHYMYTSPRDCSFPRFAGWPVQTLGFYLGVYPVLTMFIADASPCFMLWFLTPGSLGSRSPRIPEIPSSLLGRPGIPGAPEFLLSIFAWGVACFF